MAGPVTITIPEDSAAHRSARSSFKLNSVGDVWTGLGMAITKRIVEAHGGEIFVGSAEVGTEIVIRVPRTTMRKHNRD